VPTALIGTPLALVANPAPPARVGSGSPTPGNPAVPHTPGPEALAEVRRSGRALVERVKDLVRQARQDGHDDGWAVGSLMEGFRERFGLGPTPGFMAGFTGNDADAFLAVVQVALEYMEGDDGQR
jgi:hypothetical protein